MKKQKITYGVSGMMEFQAIIKVGRNHMKVLFTDGSMNAMGVNPAKFTTSNYMVQHAIENSPEFKRGLIFRYNVVALDEEVRIERPKPAPDISEPSAEAPTAAVQPDTGSGMSTEPAPSIPEAEAEVDESETDEAGGTESASLCSRTEQPCVEVEFSVNDDAKDYLEQNYGAVRSKLRTRNDIVAFAEAHNVDIKFV